MPKFLDVPSWYNSDGELVEGGAAVYAHNLRLVFSTSFSAAGRLTYSSSSWSISALSGNAYGCIVYYSTYSEEYTTATLASALYAAGFQSNRPLTGYVTVASTTGPCFLWATSSSNLSARFVGLNVLSSSSTADFAASNGTTFTLSDTVTRI